MLLALETLLVELELLLDTALLELELELLTLLELDEVLVDDELALAVAAFSGVLPLPLLPPPQAVRQSSVILLPRAKRYLFNSILRFSNANYRADCSFSRALRSTAYRFFINEMIEQESS